MNKLIKKKSQRENILLLLPITNPNAKIVVGGQVVQCIQLIIIR